MSTILSRIFTGPFIVTVLRYLLGAVGAWLFTRGLIDEGTWATISGAILTIVVALMGGADAVKDKAVIDGKAVAVNALPADARARLEAAVSVTKPRTILDILFGR